MQTYAPMFNYAPMCQKQYSCIDLQYPSHKQIYVSMFNYAPMCQKKYSCINLQHSIKKPTAQ